MNISEINDIAGRFDISDSEAKRIAANANNEAEFIEIWEHTDWWTDGNTARDTLARNNLLERFENQLHGAVDYQLGHNKNRYVCDDRLDAERIADYLQTDFLGPFPFRGSDTWWVWEEHTAIHEQETAQ